MWQEVLTAIGGTAALGVAAAWLIKSLVALWLSKDIEAYKTRLSAASQREIAEHKAQLDRLNKEHEIRFGVLQEKRAEHLAELYGFIQDAHDQAMALSVGLQQGRFEDQKQRAEAAFLAARDGFVQFKRRRLYLSAESAMKVKQLFLSLVDPSLSYVGHQRGDFTADQVREAANKFDAKKDEMEETLQVLEREFRAILGSETFK